MVGQAIKVATELENYGIEASVVDMHTIKPLDMEAIDLDKKLIVTLEEHNTIGGLGSAVAEQLSSLESHPKHLAIGINDRFLPVGNYQYLLEQCGLDVQTITQRIKETL